MSEQNQESTRPPPLRPLLIAAEVAVRMGVSVATVWRWVRKGKLHPYRLTSHTIRFDPAELDELLKRVADDGRPGT